MKQGDLGGSVSPTTSTTITGLHGLLAPDAGLKPLHSGGRFYEGPVWIPEERALRWSDVPADQVLQYSEATGGVELHPSSGGFANGRTITSDGVVVQCSHGNRRVERVDGTEVSEVVSRWDHGRLNSPNDVVVTGDGSIWFTDPPYGIVHPDEGHPGASEYGDSYVFRHEPSTGRTIPVVIDVEEPNGLAFSPDESILYVADTSCVRRPPGVGNHNIRAYDVQDGRCKNGRVFAVIDSGFADGFRVDCRGNVWTSTGSGVSVYDPQGAHLGHIGTPEVVGNVCFGGDTGRTLFIAATSTMYAIETTVVDAGARALA